MSLDAKVGVKELKRPVLRLDLNPPETPLG